MARRRRSHRRPLVSFALRAAGLAMVLAGFALLSQQAEGPPTAEAQDADAGGPVAAPPVGHLITVRLPIAGNADQVVRTQIRHVLENHRRRNAAGQVVIVLELGDSEEESGRDSEFGRCYELARYLLSEELNDVRTVTYVPHRLNGHALLVAMACQEIVMHEDAVLGRADAGALPIGNVEREAYADIYAQRQTWPAALALAMLDPCYEVYRSYVQGASRWVLGDELESLKEEPGFTGFETVVKQGRLAEFSADELRSKFAIISRKVADRADLASALKLQELTDDPTIAAQWRALRVDLRGGITETQAEGQPFLVLCRWIESPGGSAADAVTLIEEIEGLRRDGVFVAAYVPSLARSDAAIIAMACDRVSVGPDAVIGGSGAEVLRPNEVSDLVERIKTIAKARGTRWSLWAAMVDRELIVHEYTQKGTNQLAWFTQEEWQALRDKDQWEQGAILSDAGSLLKVSGTEAVELNLADHTADSLADFQREFHLENEPELVEENWVHWLIEALKGATFLPYFLLFFGTSALITELSSPGLFGPGFVALVFYLLFFWLAFLKGDATALEALLFVAGVVCIALEIFVVPGFGIFGLGGGTLVVISIILASQTFVIPRNEYQFEQVPQSLLSVITVGAGLLISLFLMRKYLDKAPGLRGVMLAPPSDAELAEVSRRESLADFAHLQGKRGEAATMLMPSGKARFGDDLVNVITDGAVVEKGTPVVVVGVHGNLVMVEPIE